MKLNVAPLTAFLANQLSRASFQNLPVQDMNAAGLGTGFPSRSNSVFPNYMPFVILVQRFSGAMTVTSEGYVCTRRTCVIFCIPWH